MALDKPVKEQTKTELSEFCSTCAKPIRKLRKGSLTGWIFRSDSCVCSEPTPSKIRTLAPDLAASAKKPETSFPDLGDRFEILEFIGEGGMGRVFKVRDKSTDKLLAIKILRSELVQDAEAMRRFELESDAVSRLMHENLVPVHGHDKAKDGTPYLVMDYVKTESLDDLLRRERKLDNQSAISIFMQICSALEHAHSHGVVHRDLKPANILIESNENGYRAFVVDFGIAKVKTDYRFTQSLTATGDLFGSPAYMSPEQCLGTALDARSDIYSMGCVMYETLLGHPPFSAANPVQIIVKHLTEAPDTSDIPQPLSGVVALCLSKSPDERCKSMSDLQEKLINVSKFPKASSRELFTKILAIPSLVGTLCGAILAAAFHPLLAPLYVSVRDPAMVIIFGGTIAWIGWLYFWMKRVFKTGLIPENSTALNTINFFCFFSFAVLITTSTPFRGVVGSVIFAALELYVVALLAKGPIGFRRPAIRWLEYGSLNLLCSGAVLLFLFDLNDTFGVPRATVDPFFLLPIFQFLIAIVCFGVYGLRKFKVLSQDGW